MMFSDAIYQNIVIVIIILLIIIYTIKNQDFLFKIPLIIFINSVFLYDYN